MAKHIHNLQIDSDLKAGSPSIVKGVAALTIRRKTRRHYSFATKYCSWHFPEKFPIFDNVVGKLLWNYQTHYSFGSFERADLKEYERYKEVLEAFKHHFSLETFAFREIDRFLWYYGKDLSQ
jgi:hypothetical protein